MATLGSQDVVLVKSLLIKMNVVMLKSSKFRFLPTLVLRSRYLVGCNETTFTTISCDLAAQLCDTNNVAKT